MNYPTNEERNQALHEQLAEDVEVDRLDSYENKPVLDDEDRDYEIEYFSPHNSRGSSRILKKATGLGSE